MANKVTILFIDEEHKQHMKVSDMLSTKYGGIHLIHAYSEEEAVDIVSGKFGQDICALIEDLGLKPDEELPDGRHHPGSGVACAQACIAALKAVHGKSDVPVFLRSKLDPVDWYEFLLDRMSNIFSGYIWKEEEEEEWDLKRAFDGYYPGAMFFSPRAKANFQRYIGGDHIGFPAGYSPMPGSGLLVPYYDDNPDGPDSAVGSKGLKLNRKQALVFYGLGAGYLVPDLVEILEMTDQTIKEQKKALKKKLIKATGWVDYDPRRPSRLTSVLLQVELGKLVDAGLITVDPADTWEAQRRLDAAKKGKNRVHSVAPVKKATQQRDERQLKVWTPTFWAIDRHLPEWAIWDGQRLRVERLSHRNEPAYFVIDLANNHFQVENVATGDVIATFGDFVTTDATFMKDPRGNFYLEQKGKNMGQSISGKVGEVVGLILEAMNVNLQEMMDQKLLPEDLLERGKTSHHTSSQITLNVQADVREWLKKFFQRRREYGVRQMKEIIDGNPDELQYAA